MKTFNHVDSISLPELLTEEVSGKRYYVTPYGKLPSITTILSYFKTKDLEKWRNRIGHTEANKITRIAANRGTKTHSLIESYLKNSVDYTNVMPDTKQMFLSMRDVLDRIDNIHHMECALYSKNLGAAGRTDTIAEFDDVLSIIDYKTSAKTKRESYIESYFEQTSAYAEMYEELTGVPINQIVVIIAVEGSQPQLFVKDKKQYLPSLKTKIETYRKENAHVS